MSRQHTQNSLTILGAIDATLMPPAVAASVICVQEYVGAAVVESESYSVISCQVRRGRVLSLPCQTLHVCLSRYVVQYSKFLAHIASHTGGNKRFPCPAGGCDAVLNEAVEVQQHCDDMHDMKLSIRECRKLGILNAKALTTAPRGASGSGVLGSACYTTCP